MAGVSMKGIKLRIRSMESTKQITKAMEMVASSKLRRAQEKVARSRPYFETLYRTMKDIASRADSFSSPYLKESEGKRRLYVVIAGDRGLAGGYNHNVLKLAENELRNDDLVLPIGKKAIETMRAHGREIVSESFNETAEISVSTSFSISKMLCEDFLNGKFDELYIVYTNFASLLSQSPVVIKALPLDSKDMNDRDNEGPVPFTIYEPDGNAVFDSIAPEYVGGLIFGAVCESVASEQAARRTAMDAATKNADDMISDLSLKYNRARQGAITQEITEIVAGADA